MKMLSWPVVAKSTMATKAGARATPTMFFQVLSPCFPSWSPSLFFSLKANLVAAKPMAANITSIMSQSRPPMSPITSSTAAAAAVPSGVSIPTFSAARDSAKESNTANATCSKRSMGGVIDGAVINDAPKALIT